MVVGSRDLENHAFIPFLIKSMLSKHCLIALAVIIRSNEILAFP
jgi:hypothetical protein